MTATTAVAVLPGVMTASHIGVEAVATLLARFGMDVVQLADAAQIPGSYWGDSEAGLIDNRVYMRPDTPIHSVLHEACHYICMDRARRAGLNRDAGGDYDEENAVCYLQIILSEQLPPLDRRRMWADMDAWGYTFRLGSAQAWFEQDAGDARDWLIRHGILDSSQQPTWRVRDSA